jgi:formamidopyrimidine-DNA glycosylase
VPELPDVTVYVESLARRIGGARLEAVRLASPFLLRSVDPPLDTCLGQTVRGVERVGKRIAIGLEDERFLLIHLMIAGRLRWGERGAKVPGKLGLAAFDFSSGTLLLTEAGTKKRASLHVVRGRERLREHDAGGIDPLTSTTSELARVLRSEAHTIKRALTDPRLLSGIGNAYSDEILHRARMSPFERTDRLDDLAIARLGEAIRAVLVEWTERLRAEAREEFPTKVTAFREGMAVHGRYRKPCPACGSPVQRIVYADNEANYCATCQTSGRLLADRALSRLLREDWPRTLEELEQLRSS